MIATITAAEDRIPQSVSFEVDENTFVPETVRDTSVSTSIDGTGIVTDWGYVVGKTEIALTNVKVSEAEYQALIGMLRDRDGHTFLFAYGNRLSQVIIKTVPVSVGGDPKRVGITMQVVKEFPVITG